MPTKKADTAERAIQMNKKGYQKADILSIEAVFRFKNQDDRSFAFQCKLHKNGETVRVTMKDDDGVLLSLMKWLDIFTLHPGTDNCKFEFPADDLPVCVVGWRGSGVGEKAYLSNIHSKPAELKPSTAPTPTIPQRSEDDIRHALAKIASDYSVTEETFLLWIPEIGNIEEAAKDNIGAQLFLDKFQNKCLDYSRAKAGIADPTPEQAREMLSGRGIHDGHIDTGETTVTEDTDLQTLNAHTESLKDWFPREDDESPAVLTVGEKAVAAIEAIKAKKDSDIIDGEIVSEENDPKPAPEETDFKLAAGKQVAAILTTAFPEATPGWKFNFFKEALGYDGVNPSIDAIGPAKMFEKLNAAIAEAKKVEGNLPAPEKPSETPPISTDAPSTPVEPVSSNGGAPDKKDDTSSKALTVAPQQQKSVAFRPRGGFLMPSGEEWTRMKELAGIISRSGYYKDINTEDKALVVMMKGYILDVDPISALDGIYVISGRPYLSAKLLKGLVERTGQCHRFDVVSEAERCIVTIQRKGREKPNIIQFTKDDAVKAGLWGNGTWAKYPQDMLRNRAVMRAVKIEFPDVDLGPMANEEEQEFAEPLATAS